jgi:ribosomal protein L20A (L18A)
VGSCGLRRNDEWFNDSFCIRGDDDHLRDDGGQMKSSKEYLPIECEINALSECFGGEFNYSTVPEKRKVNRKKVEVEVIVAVQPIRRKRG